MLYPEVPQELSSTVPGSLGVEPFGINIRTGAGQVEFLYIFSILSLLLSTAGAPQDLPVPKQKSTPMAQPSRSSRRD